MSGEKTKLEVQTIGLEPIVKKEVEKFLIGMKVNHLPTDIKSLMDLKTDSPVLLLCGPELMGVSAQEIAQLFRMRFQNVPMFYICEMRKGYDRRSLVKNGFSDAFLLSMDQKSFRRGLTTAIALNDSKTKLYRPIKLLDIGLDTPLDFDLFLYLPMNQRYVCFATGGQVLSTEKRYKLIEEGVNSVYVPLDKSGALDQYRARRRGDSKALAAMSATEQKDRFYDDLRDMLAAVLNDSRREATVDKGRLLLVDSYRILKTYIFNGMASTWYDRLLSLAGDTADSNYSHALNVSSYAAFFASAMGLVRPEDLALAGMFHDIGLAEVPAEIQAIADGGRKMDEQGLYEEHVEFGMDIIESRKIDLGDRAKKAIAEHHEKYSGGGYPNRLGKGRMCVEAQIVALADRFDELTTVAEGKPRIAPEKAIQILSLNEGGVFDAAVLKTIFNAITG